MLLGSLTRLKAAARPVSRFARQCPISAFTVVFRGVAGPARDAFIWMVCWLRSKVVADPVQHSGAHRADGVTGGPSQWSRARRQLPVGDCGTPTFETLHQPADHSRWTNAQEQMHVRRDHANLEHVRVVMPRLTAQKAAEELRACGIQQGRPVARGPCEVEVEAMVHPALYRKRVVRPSSQECDADHSAPCRRRRHVPSRGYQPRKHCVLPRLAVSPPCRLAV